MVKYFYIFVISLFVITSCDKPWGPEPRKCFWEFGANSCSELEHIRNETIELYQLATDSGEINEYRDLITSIDSCNTSAGCSDLSENNKY